MSSERSSLALPLACRRPERHWASQRRHPNPALKNPQGYGAEHQPPPPMRVSHVAAGQSGGGDASADEEAPRAPLPPALPPRPNASSSGGGSSSSSGSGRVAAMAALFDAQLRNPGGSSRPGSDDAVARPNAARDAGKPTAKPASFSQRTPSRIPSVTSGSTVTPTAVRTAYLFVFGLPWFCFVLLLFTPCTSCMFKLNFPHAYPSSFVEPTSAWEL